VRVSIRTGIGALYIRQGTPPLQKQIHGGCHEMNRRAGTENVMLAVGLGKASEIAKRYYTRHSCGSFPYPIWLIYVALCSDTGLQGVCHSICTADNAKGSFRG